MQVDIPLRSGWVAPRLHYRIVGYWFSVVAGLTGDWR
jgi:hypothetical protein